MRLPIRLILFFICLITINVHCFDEYEDPDPEDYEDSDPEEDQNVWSSVKFHNNVRETEWPQLAISVIARNKANNLPYFFTCLRHLDYPKDRIYLWIHTDHNEDKTVEIIKEWQERFSNQYNGVYVEIDTESGPLHKDQQHASQWSSDRFKHVIKLREMALDFARKKWADYVLMLDADAFLTDRDTLKRLVNKEYSVTAPMLLSDGMYSNFWADMTAGYFYKRIDKYEMILNKKEMGCFHVPMVHSAVLISLKTEASDRLTYNPEKIKNYDGPEDDIIAFAVNAKMNNINLTICNDYSYGFIPIPVDEDENRKWEHDKILNVKMEALGRGIILPLDSYYKKYVSYPKKTKYKMSEIFMINLERRVERRQLMEKSFQELGMDVNIIDAVDGTMLGATELANMGITLLPHYEDPYHKRPMKAGEVGCFLSHYYIWKEVCRRHLAVTLILEDDIHFVPYFRSRFMQLLDEIKTLDWDLIYIGRKILHDSNEESVSDHVVKPEYSYWTLGYLISEKGARKLVQAEPLSKLLPVDEFLPIMFDKHPNKTWKSFFSFRNLKAYSASPLLIHPTHYTGQDGYISDTEDSVIISSSNSGKADDKFAETMKLKRQEL